MPFHQTPPLYGGIKLDGRFELFVECVGNDPSGFERWCAAIWAGPSLQALGWGSSALLARQRVLAVLNSGSSSQGGCDVEGN